MPRIPRRRRRRRCPFCKALFVPHPRPGVRQWGCDAPAMMRGLALSLFLVVPLLAAQSAAAYHEEVALDKATLTEIQGALFGHPAKPGLLVTGRPFKARFRDVVATRPEAWQLVGITRDAANLPPDSVLEIQGHIDGRAFEVKMESNEGREMARLDALPFPDRMEVARFLDDLKGRGMRDVKLDAPVGFQHVVGRIDNGQTRIEG